MKFRPLFFFALPFFFLASLAYATQATDTTITIVNKTTGVTPLISQFALQASDTSVLQSIQFTIAAKPGSVTRLFSQTYSAAYLTTRGYLQPDTGEIFLPVYGLYASYTNTVTLDYRFLDGSSKQVTSTFTTGSFTDPCGISTPNVLKARTGTPDLSYDFMLVRGACGSGTGISPVILDTDGEVRWFSPFPNDAILTAGSGFFEHAVYVTQGSKLYRVDLDGTITELHDYSDLGVINFHHEIDPGRAGMVLDADTESYAETVNLEVNGSGNVIKTWNMADIISDAMTAGGDDPGQFVFPTPIDWWHNNSVTYRKSDNSQIISSRENLVIALDYNTDAIRWILGDTTKKWATFPSLLQYSLDLAPGTLPPIGQHSVSITQDDGLLLMDNGRNSQFQTPMGVNRTYSSPRKYSLDLEAGVATEVWNYPWSESIYSQFCGSVYEDEPLNYLIDYAFITNILPSTAQLVGLKADGEQVFDYEYATGGCNTAYNSTPLHAEQLCLSDAGQTLNISTRGVVMGGENVLIAGFIVTGFEDKDFVLRALGPSLANTGVSGTLPNPVLTLYNSSGAMIASNDDWGSAPAAAEIQAQGLAPLSPSEAALFQKLAPGAYTVVVSDSNGGVGVALVEAYDLSRNSNSEMGNVSTRGFVGTDEQALISGFIIGDRQDEKVVLRAIGPSLAGAGVSGTLNDPVITVFDSNGALIGSNDSWQSDPNADFIQRQGLAPLDPAEAATLLTLTPGSYTAVVNGALGGTGVGLAEVYNLP